MIHTLAHGFQHGCGPCGGLPQAQQEWCPEERGGDDAKPPGTVVCRKDDVGGGPGSEWHIVAPASSAERRYAAQRDDAVFMVADLGVAASGSCSGGDGTHALRAVLPVSVGKRSFAA
ncbi:hypothetical protein C2I33_07765 [Ralstonia solanacearum]|nr:hypothetical protein C2I33_07765 [Ralstonia solanacearum]